MLNSEDRSSKEILHSLPIAVWFAGFESNTLKLAAAGWGLSMRQIQSHRLGGVEMQLAMQMGDRAGSSTYALSSPVLVDFMDLHRGLNDVHHYAELLMRIRFDIMYVAPNFQFRIMPRMDHPSSFRESWQAVDARPQVRDETIDMHDFKFFKIANPALKDIIVSPDQVPELMNMVLKAQEITMKDIRTREKSRENLQKFREDMMNVKPAHQVQAQIITLCA